MSSYFLWGLCGFFYLVFNLFGFLMPAGLVFAIFLVSKMDYKIIKMSSVRNWQSERFENKLRTDKP